MGILLDAMNGKPISRAPVVPKIWVDLAAKLTDKDCMNVFQDPAEAAATVVEAAVRSGCDGARLFLFAPREIHRDEKGYYQVKNGKRIGKVDDCGGWGTSLDSDEDFDWNDPAMVIPYNIYKTGKPRMGTIEAVERMRIPSLEEFDRLYGDTVERCLQTADGKLDLMGDCNSGTLSFCVAMNGMSQALMDMYDDPELLHAMMNKGIELCIMQAKFLLSKGIRILRYNDSSANMMVISPDSWREFIKPYITRFCTEVHAHCPEAKIYCHICGGVMPILKDLMETGLDCIAPLDPLGGHTIKEIREVVGDRFMLMGGMDTMSFINHTPEQIKEEAKRCITEGFRNGYYAIGSGCAMPLSATLEGLLAIADASWELGK